MKKLHLILAFAAVSAMVACALPASGADYEKTFSDGAQYEYSLDQPFLKYCILDEDFGGIDSQSGYFNIKVLGKRSVSVGGKDHSCWETETRYGYSVHIIGDDSILIDYTIHYDMVMTEWRMADNPDVVLRSKTTTISTLHDNYHKSYVIDSKDKYVKTETTLTCMEFTDTYSGDLRPGSTWTISYTYLENDTYLYTESVNGGNAGEDESDTNERETERSYTYTVKSNTDVQANGRTFAAVKIKVTNEDSEGYQYIYRSKDGMDVKIEDYSSEDELMLRRTLGKETQDDGGFLGLSSEAALAIGLSAAFFVILLIAMVVAVIFLRKRMKTVRSEAKAKQGPKRPEATGSPSNLPPPPPWQRR